MEKKTQQRIVGALALVGLIAIFFPLLLSRPYPLVSHIYLENYVPKPPALPKAKLEAPSTDLIKEENVVTEENAKASENNTPLPDAWVVQLGAFSDGNNAERLMKQARTEGYDAFIRKQNVDDKPVSYQVLVGPEVDKDKISKLQEEINGVLKVKGIVKQYTVETEE